MKRQVREQMMVQNHRAESEVGTEPGNGTQAENGSSPSVIGSRGQEGRQSPLNGR